MSDASTALLNKVRGLLAKAEDPAATPHEAEAFSAKAEQLIAKYAIDTALLEAKENRGKPVLREYPCPEPYGKAKASLLHVIAEAHACKMVRFRGSQGTTLRVVGFESDQDLVDLLYTSLLLQATHAVLRERSSSRSFRTSFWYAFAWRVGERLKETRAKAVREETEAHVGSALVLANRDHEVDSFARESFGKVTKAAPARVTSSAGYNSGVNAANRANLNQRGVGGTKKALR